MRRFRQWSGIVLVGLLLVLHAERLSGQYRSEPRMASRSDEVGFASLGQAATRPEFPGSEVMLRQSTAGLVGGVAGALAILLPLAAADRGDAEVSDDAMTVGAILGYLGGSAVGVQLYSNRREMRGSWWGTLGGASVGVLGGPIMLVTVPIGAMAGFNLTRQD